jgi:hypothetical protein
VKRILAVLAGVSVCVGGVWAFIENSSKIVEFVAVRTPTALIEWLGLAPEPAGVADLSTLVDNRFAADDLYTKTMGAAVVDRALRLRYDDVERRYRIYRNHLGLLLTIDTDKERTASLYLPSSNNKYVAEAFRRFGFDQPISHFDPKQIEKHRQAYVFDGRFDRLGAMMIYSSPLAFPNYTILYLATHNTEYSCPLSKDPQRMRQVTDPDCVIHNGYKTEPFPLPVRPLIGHIFTPKTLDLRSFPGGSHEWLPLTADTLGEMFSQEIGRQLTPPSR